MKVQNPWISLTTYNTVVYMFNRNHVDLCLQGIDDYHMGGGPTKHHALPSINARKCPLPSITAHNSPELQRVSGKYTCPGQFLWELQKGGQLYTFSFIQWTNRV